MAFLTMEVLGWYWRARPGTRGHVCPANRTFAACRPCPRMPARAQADVPVSYPRAVVYFPNRQLLRAGTWNGARVPALCTNFPSQ
jgi:hypothetical protein